MTSDTKITLRRRLIAVAPPSSSRHRNLHQHLFWRFGVCGSLHAATVTLKAPHMWHIFEHKSRVYMCVDEVCATSWERKWFCFSPLQVRVERCELLFRSPQIIRMRVCAFLPVGHKINAWQTCVQTLQYTYTHSNTYLLNALVGFVGVHTHCYFSSPLPFWWQFLC